MLVRRVRPGAHLARGAEDAEAAAISSARPRRLLVGRHARLRGAREHAGRHVRRRPQPRLLSRSRRPRSLLGRRVDARLRREKTRQPAAGHQRAAEGLVHPAGRAGSGLPGRHRAAVHRRHAEGAPPRGGRHGPRLFQGRSLGPALRQGAAGSLDRKGSEAARRAAQERDDEGARGRAAAAAAAARVPLAGADLVAAAVLLGRRRVGVARRGDVGGARHARRRRRRRQLAALFLEREAARAGRERHQASRRGPRAQPPSDFRRRILLRRRDRAGGVARVAGRRSSDARRPRAGRPGA